MGFPYFIWNSIDSRNKGVWVSQYPSRIRAEERVTEVTVAGRAGQLTLHEGEAVYEPIKLQMRLQTLNSNDFEALNNWLRGSGVLVLGRDSGIAYNAQITDEISWDKYSNDIAEATVSFDCDPLKIAYPAETAVTLTQAGSVTNSGNVVSKPLITITGSGDISLTANGYTISVTDVTAKVVIDCDAMLVYEGDANMMDKSSGDFPLLKVGTNAVSWTGTVTKVEILLNQRWV